MTEPMIRKELLFVGIVAGDWTTNMQPPPVRTSDDPAAAPHPTPRRIREITLPRRERCIGSYRKMVIRLNTAYAQNDAKRVSTRPQRQSANPRSPFLAAAEEGNSFLSRLAYFTLNGALSLDAAIVLQRDDLL
ncbi:hypothetical protein KIN20_024258 [Parelaphostrongylus tenuis]|uniref:Uncharacterized protein n=1 Tax=Parelaphostrongylus tenuis TaxID=148309 RepID=A0AAD5MWS3_PARTN|nr:hypothetical protein KIN20_024258 [Parelaphostrongylus tenuis]